MSTAPEPTNRDVSATTSRPAPPRVVIIGGGLAGLSAAAALVDRGLSLTLLESRPRLGGRAGSFQDAASGELVDNCQHVGMACCTNLLDFARRVGVERKFRRDPAVVWLGPDGRLSRLRAGVLPAPLHLAAGFLRLKFLSMREKIGVARALATLFKTRDELPGEPFADWLTRHGQGVRAINLFWGAVLVSALNERLEQMDVGHARKVFLDGFARHRDGYQMELPLAPLGEIFGAPVAASLARAGVEIRLNAGVREILSARLDDLDETATTRVNGVRLRSGETIDADFVVLAVPFDRVAALLPDAPACLGPALDAIATLKPAPITGIHLWFDRPVCPHPHVVTVGRVIQWVFNHTLIQGRVASEDGGHYLQLVVSASYDLVPLDRDRILDVALRELGEIWPAARDAKLLRSRVVTEHGATFGVRPGVDALRPAQRTPVGGLFLAGDWTDTGWPATMEGAVRSGYRAAEEVLVDLDRPEHVLVPDLPPSRLSQRLFGLTRGDQPRAGFVPTVRSQAEISASAEAAPAAANLD